MAGFTFQSLVDDVEAVAKKASDVLPGAGLVDAGLEIGQSIIGLIDTLKHSGKAATIADLDIARAQLEATVGAKSEQLSKDLRGQ